MVAPHNDDLHKAASHRLYEFARELRQVSTQAERMLWLELRNRKLNGLKFRRQHPLDRYIADFYCHEKKLVIELDGVIHYKKEKIEYDKARTLKLEGLGIFVTRFSNEEVQNHMEQVLQKIARIAGTR